MADSADKDVDLAKVPSSFQGIRDLEAGLATDETDLLRMCEFVDRRLDCSDFKMTTLLRTIYAYRPLLSPSTVATIKAAILRFKYGVDEPGVDSMCYWTENHQILFATAEYLAGQLYPDERFANSGMTGTMHMEKARSRIVEWLGHRFRYGFSEWHSNTYYEEDIGPLSVLIDFCRDEELVVKATMIMDLLLLDMAMHSYRGLFAAGSGRCYETQKKHPLHQSTWMISEHVWGHGHMKERDYRKLSANFILSKQYDVPEVIVGIGQDRSDTIVKDSMGLDLEEVDAEFRNGGDMEAKGRFLWGMGSFAHPRSLQLTMELVRRWRLQHNSFLSALNRLSANWIIKSGMLPLLSRLTNPVQQGAALQRANCYTYKTSKYMLSTIQSYHPGEFSYQQHIWQATLSERVAVFTTHPGISREHYLANRQGSPGYWVGNGILPHSAQDKNVHLSIYNLRSRRGLMEPARQPFTHAYFPWQQFDEVIGEGKYLFGRLGDVYLSLIGRYALTPVGEDRSDIIQKGKRVYWICEIETAERYPSFEHYTQEVRSRKISFHRGRLKYYSSSVYELKYKKHFRMNGEDVPTRYERLESPYGRIVRKAKEIRIHFQDRSLTLQFEKGIRRIT